MFCPEVRELKNKRRQLVAAVTGVGGGCGGEGTAGRQALAGRRVVLGRRERKPRVYLDSFL